MQGQARLLTVIKSLNNLLNMSVYKVPGLDCELEVFDDKVTIAPKGIGGFLNRGFKGIKTIPFTSITAVKHKRAGFTAGYLQFTLPGGIESRGGLLAAAEDENTFVFKNSENEVIEEIKVFIEQKTSEAKNRGAAANASTSPADELLKLAKLKEQGLLSDEEFSKAKQKILGIS